MHLDQKYILGGYGCLAGMGYSIDLEPFAIILIIQHCLPVQSSKNPGFIHSLSRNYTLKGIKIVQSL